MANQADSNSHAIPILRSQLGNIIAIKYVSAIVCLFLAAGLSTAPLTIYGRIVIILFTVAALFAVSLATMEIRGGRIRYRRILRWNEIAPSEIVRVGLLWAPFVAYVRLEQFVFPWGRIYFALDTNERLNPLGKGRYPLLEFLKQSKSQSHTGA
jgi:hypothetical protein